MKKTLSRYTTNEQGSITPVMIACIALVLLLCLLTADFGLYLSARHEAQNAADATALSAVAESFPLMSTEASPEKVASKYARENNASLDRLHIYGGGEKVQVTVSVQTKSLLLKKLGIMPGKVKACAAAEIDLDALTLSNHIWYTCDPSKLANLGNVLANLRAKDASSASTIVALLALQHLGKPYVWGATGPNSFDCSGLICYVFAQIGVYLPRVTFSQVHAGRAVAPTELAPGDLVFFRGNAHVGMYLGDGCFIHAPHSGDVVRVSPLGARSDLSGCRRVI